MDPIQTHQLPSNPTKDDFKGLATTTGVYIFRKGEDYLYVGKSVNIRARVYSHFENAKLDEKEHAIIYQSDRVETIITDSEFTALLLEAKLIQKHLPKYNVIWKDGKSHLYIKITAKETYPKIYAVRRENDKKSLYFGPFSSSRHVTSLIRMIRKIIPFCMERNIGKKACFSAKINLCNPCPNDIEQITDPQLQSIAKKEYRHNIKKVIALLEGKGETILSDLSKELEQYKKQENYESALVIRDRMTTLSSILMNKSFDRIIETSFDSSGSALASLHGLLSPYFKELTLQRIECFDISNLSFNQATASMVVLENGHIEKSQYRKFKIRNLDAHSDFEMLSEVIARRFKNKWTKPGLLVLDGGKPQVKKILPLLRKNNIRIPLIGIAKHPDRFVVGIDSYPTLRPSVHDKGLQLIQMLRDESHRFAKKYHLLLREREAFHT